jgi:hypothetical protein
MVPFRRKDFQAGAADQNSSIDRQGPASDKRWSSGGTCSPTSVTGGYLGTPYCSQDRGGRQYPLRDSQLKRNEQEW